MQGFQCAGTTCLTPSDGGCSGCPSRSPPIMASCRCRPRRMASRWGTLCLVTRRRARLWHGSTLSPRSSGTLPDQPGADAARGGQQLRDRGHKQHARGAAGGGRDGRCGCHRRRAAGPLLRRRARGIWYRARRSRDSRYSPFRWSNSCIATSCAGLTITPPYPGRPTLAGMRGAPRRLALRPADRRSRRAEYGFDRGPQYS